MNRCVFTGLAAVLAMAMFALACGGEAKQTPPAPAVNVTGTWRGVIVRPGSEMRVWLTATQPDGGAEVAGSYVTDGASTGTVTGTVEGDLFRFQATVTTPGCPGELKGSARVAAGATPVSMALDYAGTTECGPEAGLFVLEREIPAPPQ